ncbi:sugar phosphate isomerase/epimerase [Rhodococcoides fascians A25f]|uniref:sugar phosphate isomerase/epimerase family protein n=1 Tax=Rhodococcoides fascians TaxID=1828 RepID=UPI0013FD3ADA|nr:sugar phosphate isomerase/epimerase [Rhodococcus fascians]QII07269.1 sugar phosphate isomerase/epimerase [Rhodococcus fascians A25f]
MYDEPLPVFIAAAAGAGADSVCLSINRHELLDPATLRTTLTQIDDAGMTISMGDGFLINAAGSMEQLKRQLDLLVELGAPYANACAFEADETVVREPGSVQDTLGELAVLAEDLGLGVLIEFTPLSHVPTLAAAAALVAKINQPNLKIMLDTLHLARAGEGPDDIANVDSDLFGYCQISDGPLGTMDLSAYMMEAVHNRGIPGSGDLPLVRILELLPRDITVSAEVPLQALREVGVSPHERARRVIEGSRRVVDGIARS